MIWARQHSWKLAIPTALLLQQAVALHADIFTWQAGTGGNWSDEANWANNLPPVNDLATQIILNDSSPGTYVYTLDNAQPVWILNGITANRNVPALPVVLNVATDSSLEFAGTSPFLQGPIGTSLSLNGPVVLDSMVSVTAFGLMSFAGPISGPGGITLQPSDGVTQNTLVLSGANTFAGGVTLLPAATTLIVETPGALGTGPLAVDLTSSSMNLQLEAQPGSITNFAHSLTLNSTAAFSGTFFNIIADGATAGHLFVLPSVQVNGNAHLAFGVTANNAPEMQWQINALEIAGTLLLGGYSGPAQSPYYGTVTLGSIQESIPSLLKVSQNMSVHITGSGSYSGGTSIAGGHVFADAPHALGTGPVTLSTLSTLTLNASDAVASNLSIGRVEYNANGAAGGHNISQAYLSFGPAVTSFNDGTATDTFSNLAGLRGNSVQLAMLDRGVGSGTTPNVSFAFEAEIENTDGILPTVKNLGIGSDLILGLGTTGGSNFPVTLGTGTPWQSLDSAAYSGTITANGPFGMYGTYVNGPSTPLTIAHANGIQPVTTSLWNVTLAASFANYAGVSTFSNAGSATLSVDNALGGAAGTTPIPMDVFAQGNLTVSSPGAINAPVHFYTNSILTIQSPGLFGSGALSRDAAPITISLANPLALSGAQLAGLIQSGDTVILAASDIENLSSLDPSVNLVVIGSDYTQSGTLGLGGGGLKVRTPSGTLTPTPGSSSLLQIGGGGATFYGALPLSISTAIAANGDVTVQSDTAITSHGLVNLENPNNVFHGNINLVSGGLTFSSPGAASGAVINLRGGTVTFLNPSQIQASEYDNQINVLGNVTIPSFVPLPSAPELPIELGNVTLSSGTITFGQALNHAYSTLTISTLTVGGPGNIVFPQGGRGVIQIGSVAQGGSAQSLALTQPSRSGSTIYQFTGLLSITGLVTIGGEAIFDGTTTPAPATFNIGSNPGDTLAGTGTIHRTVNIGPFGTLSPGDVWQLPFVSLPGTLSVDALTLSSSTILNWDLGQAGVIGGPNNDLVAVAGDLTLAGNIDLTPQPGFTNGRYVLFTYGGKLINMNPLINFTSLGPVAGLDLSVPGQVACIVLNAAPEPTTLATLGLGAIALLARRRKKREIPG